VLFDNEKAVAYQLTNASLNNNVISGRGPIIAELVSGKASFHAEPQKTVTEMQAGKYLYIPPGSSFYFSTKGNDQMNMIVFEIR
jgi:hypothetical protein